MVDFFVKKEEKVVPLDKTPKWEQAIEKGKRRLEKIKFESEAQKRDYLKQVGKNPLNVPGYPDFYPPETSLWWSVGIGSGEPTEILPCGHRWLRKSYDLKKSLTYTCKHGHEFNHIKEQPK